jgi:endo-1,4-beta-xylanase
MRAFFFIFLALSVALTYALPSKSPSLKDAYQSHFLIGVAVSPSSYADTDSTEARLIKTHFNVITPENIMKWSELHPTPDRYDFRATDQLVEFATKNNIHVIGHTLVWHQQTPDWVFQDASGNLLARDALLARMRDHIMTVVGRYKGRIKAWDVVNEALAENGTLHDSPWRKIIGEDFIEKAFQYAHEADPEAKLYYNDFRLEVPSKRAGAVALVKRLKAAGLRIDAVGIQGHVNLARPTVEEQEATILELHNAGVQTMITELDVDVLPSTRAWGDADIRRREADDPAFNPYVDGLPPEIQAKLTQRYAELFRMYLKNQDKIDRVTLWGLNDGDSWLNETPIIGRTNHPLLFDRNNNPKPALQALINEAKAYKPIPALR